MNEKLKQVHVKRLLAFALIIIIVGMGSYQVGKSTVGPGQQSEQWYTPEQEATYIIGPFNTTFFFAKNHTGYGFSAYEGYELLEANDDDLIQFCINNTTTDGGYIYVKEGTYSASVTLKDKVWLTLAEGAATITVSINAGATCVLEDRNAGRVRSWKAAVLVWDNDLDAGSLSLSSLEVTGAAIADSFNSTTYYVGSTNVTGNMLTGGTTWQGSWNATVAELITNSAIAWGQITNANATVQQLVGLYQDFSWQDSWNATVEDIVLNAAVAWSQITNANATVNQLIAASTISWSQITNANATVQQLVETYQSFAWQGAWNSTVVQLASSLTNLDVSGWVNSTAYYLGGQQIGFIQPYTFLINVTGSTYNAWYGANSTLAESSSNASQVINNALGNLTVGRTWQETVYLKGNCSIDDTILFDSHTQIILDGIVNMKATTNKDMLRTRNQSIDVHDFTLEGGVWNGSGQSATCNIFNFTQTVDANLYNPIVKIRNVEMINAYGDALHLDYTGSGQSPIFEVENGNFYSIYGYGLYISKISDSLYKGNFFGTDQTVAIYGYSFGASVLSDFKTNGGLDFSYAAQVTMGNFWLDVVNRNIDGILLTDCNEFNVANGHIRIGGSNNFNTSAAIHVRTDEATRGCFNQFSNIYAGRPYSLSGTDVWKYAVFEDTAYGASPSYNLYTAINGNDTATMGLYLLPNSHASNCFNGTYGWVDHI